MSGRVAELIVRRSSLQRCCFGTKQKRNWLLDLCKLSACIHKFNLCLVAALLLFFKPRVSPWLLTIFLSKVVLEFHFNREINLPIRGVSHKSILHCKFWSVVTVNVWQHVLLQSLSGRTYICHFLKKAGTCVLQDEQTSYRQGCVLRGIELAASAIPFLCHGPSWKRREAQGYTPCERAGCFPDSQGTMHTSDLP